MSHRRARNRRGRALAAAGCGGGADGKQHWRSPPAGVPLFSPCRQLHANPELSSQENATSALVRCGGCHHGRLSSSWLRCLRSCCRRPQRSQPLCPFLAPSAAAAALQLALLQIYEGSSQPNPHTPAAAAGPNWTNSASATATPLPAPAWWARLAGGSPWWRCGQTWMRCPSRWVRAWVSAAAAAWAASAASVAAADSVVPVVGGCHGPLATQLALHSPNSRSAPASEICCVCVECIVAD